MARKKTRTPAATSQETAESSPTTAPAETQPTAAPATTDAADGGISAPEAETSRPTGEPLISDAAVTPDEPLKSHLVITVYAISKNEAKFVSRWMDSMKEADHIVVLDTGSTDDTVRELTALGAKVETKAIKPWRFDVARNESIDLALRLVPDTDLLVCTDLDEILLPGWREKLEREWLDAMNAYAAGRIKSKPTTAQYEYVWNFKPDGSDGTKFWYEKIHTPESKARWTHPVHEILSYPDGKKTMVRVDGMRLEHHADPAKSRGQYLALLEMSVTEDPDDDRNMHYLGREYMFRRRWSDSIKTLKRHLALPRATWNAERAASMRFIARCYNEQGNAAEAELWLWRAVVEAPEQREATLELAEMLYKQKEYKTLVKVCEILLSRKNRVMSYLTHPEAWGFRPYDLYAIGLWYSGRRKEALTANAEAIKLCPEADKGNHDRLVNNQRIMDEAYAANAKTE